jgi:hypothetical protein
VTTDQASLIINFARAQRGWNAAVTGLTANAARRSLRKVQVFYVADLQIGDD